MAADLRSHGPTANADVIDLAEQRRRNALFALDVLVRAYVPKNTNDWREGLAALQVLQEQHKSAGGAGAEPLGRCCYGGAPKPKRDCASCAAWTPIAGVLGTGDNDAS